MDQTDAPLSRKGETKEIATVVYTKQACWACWRMFDLDDLRHDLRCAACDDADCDEQRCRHRSPERCGFCGQSAASGGCPSWCEAGADTPVAVMLERRAEKES